MTGTTQELDDVLFEAVEAAATYTHNVTAEEADYIQNKAKQAVIDWHNKQMLELLDRLSAEVKRAYDREGDFLEMAVDTIEAERNKLNPSKSTPFNELKESTDD